MEQGIVGFLFSKENVLHMWFCIKIIEQRRKSVRDINGTRTAICWSLSKLGEGDVGLH